MKRFIILFALLLNLGGMLCAQHLNLSDSIVTGTEEYVNLVRLMQRVWTFNQEVPQEKVYMHFDNTGYFKGEKMWFKAYVVRTDTGMPTDMSAVLYAELVDPSGEVIQKRKVYIDKGMAVGDFSLDTLYVTGFYEVRAYTRYMMNWGGNGIFSRVFPIFKQPRRAGDYSRMEIDQFSYRKRQPNYREVPHEMLTKEEKAKGNQLKMKRLPHGQVHVNFYPEGGNLVEGLTSKVAFAVNDDLGKDFDVEGVILDENGELVRGAVTFKNGRGYFDITPDDEPKYLQLTTADGKKQKFELPEAMPEGISLTLNTLGDPDVVAMMTSTRAMHDRMVGYTLMHDGRIIACDTMTCRPQMVLKFVREELPAGVNQLTVFDADGHVLAERLFFICPKNVEAVQVTTPIDHLVPCGKVKLDIQAKPNASLSLSAMDIETMTNGKVGNVLTWMLLSSEVKGYIAHPEYYFESDDREHRMAADLLMMVQGWRRYRWNLMAGNEQFRRIYTIEDKLYVSGILMSNHREAPVENEKLRAYIFTLDTGDSAYGDCVTDSVGQFAFAVPNSWGEWHLQIVVRDVYDFGFGKSGKIGVSDRKQDYRVMIDRNFEPQPRWLSPYETDTLPHLKPNLFAEVPDSVFKGNEHIFLQKRERVLKEVKVTGRRVYDGARAAWESEREGQHWASIYYNVDKEVDRIYDNGGEIPTLYGWLYSRNPLFVADGSERYMPMQHNENVEKRLFDGGDGMVEVEEMEYENPFQNMNAYKEGVIFQAHLKGTTVKRRRQVASVYNDGLSYKNRPIVWILNNNFYSITSTNNLNLGDIEVLNMNGSPEEMPVFLDEVKAIYISENTSAADRYVWCPALKSKEAVTVFVYTHQTFPWKKNGLRQTHFQAYDQPDTFEMDDYSLVSPMEDFRRTLFWAPEVKTDEEGKATVEFWNNSSARRLYISVEGMTGEGEFMTNE